MKFAQTWWHFWKQKKNQKKAGTTLDTVSVPPQEFGNITIIFLFFFIANF